MSDFNVVGGQKKIAVASEQEMQRHPVTKVDIHRMVCEELNKIYECKNHDYGDSFAKTRAELPNVILVRLYDKLNRLKTLMQGGTQKVMDESIADTLMDLANYAIMEVVEMRIEQALNTENNG